MIRMIARRLGLMVVVLAGISVIAFVLTHVIPGNPARLLAGPHANASEVATVQREYGLVGSLPHQYFSYMNQLLHGSLGVSLTTGQPVTTNLATFLPATVELALAAAIVMILVGVPLGLWSAWREGGIVDNATRGISILGAAMPIFWLGLIFQILFYKDLPLLPAVGELSPALAPPQHITGLYVVDSLLTANWPDLWSALQHLVLPAVTLASGGIAIVARMTRSSALDVLESDYIRFGRSKGLGGRGVLLNHVLRNALIPTVTVLGLQLGYILSGTVYTEMVFEWPGVGLYAENAITNLDYSAIMGVTLLFAVIYVVVNLLVDICYMLLDPRIRHLSRAAVT
jgi:ABC-type dipeptide/oligopeptide/nickel transport system permease component